MSKHKYAFMLSVTLLATIFGIINSSPSSYTPPSGVTVQMYRLNLDGSKWVDPSTGNPALCSYSSTVYGCTAFTGSWTYRYPYGYSNPVLVPIETDYLLDVVSQEMGTITFNEEARHVQAVVARSFAYHHDFFDEHTHADTMNNSADDQVFIPYRWEKWDTGYHFSGNSGNPCYWWWTDFLPQQKLICTAVDASKDYVTGINHIVHKPEIGIYLYSQDLPAFTKFFADTPLATETEMSFVPGTYPPRHTYPYLVGVADPISSHPDIIAIGLHQNGMSQRGASRWGHGNMGAENNENRWSVKWNWEQILVHYYTNIQIRDQNGISLIPNERWNPLSIGWGTSNNQAPHMYYGNSYPITVQLQNTGTSDWNCNFPSENYQLKYRWTRNGNQTTGAGQVSVCGIDKGGASQPLNLTIQNIPNWGAGTYGLHFDVESINGTNRLWSTYTVLVCVGNEPCGDVFLPITIKSD